MSRPKACRASMLETWHQISRKLDKTSWLPSGRRCNPATTHTTLHIRHLASQLKACNVVEHSSVIGPGPTWLRCVVPEMLQTGYKQMTCLWWSVKISETTVIDRCLWSITHSNCCTQRHDKYNLHASQGCASCEPARTASTGLVVKLAVLP